jgi:hypothetical protein
MVVLDCGVYLIETYCTAACTTSAKKALYAPRVKFMPPHVTVTTTRFKNSISGKYLCLQSCHCRHKFDGTVYSAMVLSKMLVHIVAFF